MTMNTQKILKKTELCNKLISQQRPFEGHLLSQVKNFYRVATTWSSNALEGNTLTISETKVLIEDGITVSGKPLKDILEATGHAKAYDYMFLLLHTTSITEDNINMLHKLFYSGIDLDNSGNFLLCFPLKLNLLQLQYYLQVDYSILKQFHNLIILIIPQRLVTN